VAGERARRARPVGERARSQHFLRSSRLAAELVDGAGVSTDDLVVEIGAGTGKLTVELARTARRVIAVELAAALAVQLARRFKGSNVAVVHGDALEQPVPNEPFRVVANLPFHATTATLRYLLDDPRTPLTRADLILEWDSARKRAAVWPSTLLGVYWGAWNTFAVVRRLPAACFAPRPRVDGGLLSICRRAVPLVPVEHAGRFRRFVRCGFAASRLHSALRGYVSPREFKRVAEVYGFARAACGRDLDVHQWAALFRAAHASESDPSSRATKIQ
jgi:23S rRNA (adenine-N6)-dimethyltransferase